MRFDSLNEENYLFFAIQNYHNPASVTKEDFFNDMNRFKYLKRLLKKYSTTGELKTHLILNHLIVLFNIFDEAAIPLLVFKIDRNLLSILKTFLFYLDRLPYGCLDTISTDLEVLEALKEL